MTSLVSCLLAGLVCCGGDARLRIVAEPADARRVSVEATLSSEQAAKLDATGGEVERAAGDQVLTLQLIDVDARSSSPLLGSYRLEGSTLSFTPRFALSAGCTYRATLYDSAGSTLATAEYRVPQAKNGARAEVAAVYPSDERVPANLLKFYLAFSQPMREGTAIFEQVQLLDESGRALDAPWRLTELWSDDATRLTLYIHPGRIKQGVNLREQLGPVLAPGKKYTLVVTDAVRSADGQQLVREYRRSLVVGDEDHASPNPAMWRIAAPQIGTREPLAVETDEPLDRFLLARCLHVKDGHDRGIAGSATVEAGERRWKFTPQEPWRDAAYSLVVDPILEDLAGNTPARRFDTDTKEASAEPAVLRREFRPRAADR